MSTISLRDATSLDTTEIATIYAHYVRNGTATFEEIPLEDTEMAAESIWYNQQASHGVWLS